jgi:hypothetical protein
MNHEAEREASDLRADGDAQLSKILKSTLTIASSFGSILDYYREAIVSTLDYYREAIVSVLTISSL